MELCTFDGRGSNDGAAIDAVGDVILFGILGGSGGGCDDDGDVIDEGCIGVLSILCTDGTE
jgi:hypothetical protein